MKSYVLSEKFGGGMSEKALWTNPNPTSSFGNTTVTLSDSIANYDYIKIEYRESTANDTRYSVLMPTTDWSYDYCLGLVNKYGNEFYCRRFMKISDTSGQFDTNARIYSADVQNARAIPVYVYGVKL